MAIFLVSLTGVILAALLAFHFKSGQSRFEINRMAEHNHKYRALVRFLDIYPGLRALVHAVALIDAILLTSFAVGYWGMWGGGAIAFGAILLAWFLGRAFHNLASSLIAKNLDFINKRFAWAEMLGKLAMVGDEPQISSESELLHLVKEGDFLDDATKSLISNSIAFRDKSVKSVMTSRDKINFIHIRDALTPKVLDDLFTSGHKVFPVIQGSVDHTVGLLYLDDVLPIEQNEKALGSVMRKCPPPIDQSAPLEAAIRQMAEYHSPVLLVEKDGKIVGLLTMSDIIRELFKPELA